MTLRRAALRQLIACEIKAASTLAGTRVYENRALPTSVDLLPAITLSTPADHKQSLVKVGPQFTTLILVEINVRVTEATDELAVCSLERLIEQIEAATLSNQTVMNQVQQFAAVRTEQSVRVDGRVPVAEATIRIECEIYEDYRHPPFEPLLDIKATVTDQATPPNPFAIFEAITAQD